MSGSDDLTVLLASALILTGSVKAMGTWWRARADAAYQYVLQSLGALCVVFMFAALMAYLTNPR